jgi:hypothetical protein
VVTNNSEITAYSVKLLQHKKAKQIRFRTTFNPSIPFKAHEQKVLPFSIIIEKELRSIDADNLIKSAPEIFKDLMILFEYQNPDGTNFQSLYYFNNKKISYRRMKKDEIVRFWN